ncbi:hypothetical protein RRG08_049450 [Elysia crispata]|uniref:Uncharacterized protein n=1 Tax=Elysia crispata TaxID=231223 RepID=A0AAE0ZS24_9GAST|nr:hypothetical protein RRG08_049450 [Elysia crispata]
MRSCWAAQFGHRVGEESRGYRLDPPSQPVPGTPSLTDDWFPLTSAKPRQCRLGLPHKVATVAALVQCQGDWESPFCLVITASQHRTHPWPVCRGWGGWGLIYTVERLARMFGRHSSGTSCQSYSPGMQRWQTF